MFRELSSIEVNNSKICTYLLVVVLIHLINCHIGKFCVADEGPFATRSNHCEACHHPVRWYWQAHRHHNHESAGTDPLHHPRDQQCATTGMVSSKFNCSYFPFFYVTNFLFYPVWSVLYTESFKHF